MTYLNIYILGFVFLGISSRYDGDEEGGSIIDLFESLDGIMWPLIGTALVIWVIKSKYTEIFVDKPREKEYHRQFNLDYPTLKDKQEHYDQLFLKRKKETEKKWQAKRASFDIVNRAHYAERITRAVVKEDYSSKNGYSTLIEYWTYDGNWRQGYWDGIYNYNDRNWESNTLCNTIDERMGDIQPLKDSTLPYHPIKPVSEGKILKGEDIGGNSYSLPIDDDLPF